jgi:hypothetical protein
LKAESLKALSESTTLAALAGRYVMNPLSARAFADSAVSRIPSAAIFLFMTLNLRTSCVSLETRGQIKKPEERARGRTLLVTPNSVRGWGLLDQISRITGLEDHIRIEKPPTGA